MVVTKKGNQTRARVLQAARELIVKQGFGRTSISDIMAATGVKKGNLYFHFANKEEIGTAILEEARQDFCDLLAASLQGPSGLARLENFFRAVLDQQREAQFVGGCLFGNLALEMGDGHPLFAGLIQEVFSHWTAAIAEVLAEAQAQGELAPGVPPARLAHHVVAAIEGGIMMARVNKDGAALDDCLTSLLLLLSPGRAESAETVAHRGQEPLDNIP